MATENKKHAKVVHKNTVKKVQTTIKPVGREIPSAPAVPLISTVQVQQSPADYLKIDQKVSFAPDVLIPFAIAILSGVIVGLIVGWRANVFQQKIEQARVRRDEQKSLADFLASAKRELATALHNLKIASLLDEMAKQEVYEKGEYIPVCTFKENDLAVLVSVDDYATKNNLVTGLALQNGILTSYSDFIQIAAGCKAEANLIEAAILKEKNLVSYKQTWARIGAKKIPKALFRTQGPILETIVNILEFNGIDFSKFKENELYLKIQEYCD